MRQNAKKVSPMSNEGRNAYVIKHLTDAFLSLLAEKPLEDISISELSGMIIISWAVASYSIRLMEIRPLPCMMRTILPSLAR